MVWDWWLRWRCVRKWNCYKWWWWCCPTGCIGLRYRLSFFELVAWNGRVEVMNEYCLSQVVVILLNWLYWDVGVYKIRVSCYCDNGNGCDWNSECRDCFGFAVVGKCTELQVVVVLNWSCSCYELVVTGMRLDEWIKRWKNWCQRDGDDDEVARSKIELQSWWDCYSVEWVSKMKIC